VYEEAPGFRLGPRTATQLTVSRFVPGTTGSDPNFNSVWGLVSKLWYRSPFDQSEQSEAKILPTESPKIRPVAILELIDPRSRGDERGLAPLY